MSNIHFRKSLVMVVSLMFLFIIITGYSFAEKQSTIKVGLLGAMSGRYAVYGSALHGAELVFHEINEAGGIQSMGGAKIKWVYADTASSPNKVLSELERLADVEKVDAIIFSSPTSEVMAGASLYDQLQIPVISTIATSEPLFKHNLQYWRMISIPSSEYGATVIEWLKSFSDEFGVKMKRIALATAETPWLLSYLKHEKETMKKLGLDRNIVLDIKYNAKSEMEAMTSILLKVKASNPDVFIINESNSTFPHYWRAAHNIGFSPPVTFYNLTTIAYPKAWAVLGNDLMMEHVVSKPVFFGKVAHKDAPHKGYQKIKEKLVPWVEKKGLKMTDYYYLNAQAAQVFARVWKMKGTKDRKITNNTLRTLEIPFNDPDIVLPLFKPVLTWLPNGRIKHAKLPCAQWQGTLEDHNVELIFPNELRTDKPILSR
ncbi:MAG: ABC transporter substrate-binding protein [Thermodesulfobacteriota bacterium]|nr:ABC transporter substrate-binding protein [Thermodesulfobacteriota bacterium]